MRRGKRHKQRRVLIRAALEIALQMYLRPRIEINLALLVALSQHHTLPFVEIDVVAIHLHQLPHTHSGRSQQVHHRQISHFATGITQHLHILIADHLFDQTLRAHFVNTTHRTFGNTVLILQPRKETRENAPQIIDRHPTRPTFTLITSEISTNIIRIQRSNTFLHTAEQRRYGRLVVVQGVFRTTFYFLCRNKGLQQFLIRLLPLSLLAFCRHHSHLFKHHMQNLSQAQLLIDTQHA